MDLINVIGFSKDLLHLIITKLGLKDITIPFPEREKTEMNYAGMPEKNMEWKFPDMSSDEEWEERIKNFK